MKKVLIISLILIVIFLIFDLVLYSLLYSTYTQEKFKIRIADYIKSYKIIDFHDTCLFIKEGRGYRDSIITPDNNTNKKPIYLFGCSFAYGALLNDDQTFAYKLSQITGRNVYNFGISGTGLQYFLYMLEYENIEKYLPEPEYIIYLLIDNHLFRLYEYFYTDPTPNKAIRYKIINDKLVLDNPNNIVLDNPNNILFHFTLFRYLSHKYAEKQYLNAGISYNIDLMVKYFKRIKEISNKKFPNTKMVIIKYEENENSDIYSSEKWEEIEKMGYIVLDSYKLTDNRYHLCRNEYRIPNDVHPNEKAWNILTPLVVKALHL